MRKRLLSALLTVCMLLTMLPVTAFAADEPGAATDYVSLHYNDNVGVSGENRTVTVNVVDSQNNQLIGTTQFNDIQSTANKITITIVDSKIGTYDIESVNISDGSVTQREKHQDSYEFLWTRTVNDATTFTIYLCPQFENPDITGRVESADLYYRITEASLLKLLHDNGIQVDAGTTFPDVVGAVKLNFVTDYLESSEWNLDKTLSAADNLMFVQNTTVLTNNDQSQPNNIRYLEITYQQGDGEKQTKKIYSGDLRYVQVSNNTYEIESNKNPGEHIVIFYTEGTTPDNGVWTPLDVRFVKTGQPVATSEADMPTADTYEGRTFVAWTQQHNGGLPVIYNTLVNDDMNVFPQYKLDGSDPQIIRVMNNDDLLKKRVAELLGCTVENVDWNTMEVTVYGQDNTASNPDYGTAGGVDNRWHDDDYYTVHNYCTGAPGTAYENQPIPVNDISSIRVSVKQIGAHDPTSVVIKKGALAGDFAVSMGSYSSDWLVELYINANGDYPENPDTPDTPDPGPGTDYAITSITKELVESEKAATAAGITGTYTFPEDNKVIIPYGESVTLLYAITVTGKENTTFTVTDEDATLVSTNAGVSGNTGTFTGSIPEDATEITFYVSKTFTAANIDTDGNLTNSASITTTAEGGVDPDEEDDTEETPAEEEHEDLNGTDVTVQVFVDGSSTPVSNPLDYVNLSRETHDTHDGWYVGGPDPSGMLTCDFDYDAGAANSGYDCVDIRVDVTDDDTYVLQGVRSHQSYGSSGTDNVIDNENGTYTIDNVTAVYNATDPDVKIYLRTKYTVGYYENSTKSQTVTDDGAYIAGEDVTAEMVNDNQAPTEDNTSAWMDWKNDSLQTTITVKGLPTVAGTVTGWWLNDAGCSEGGTLYGPDKTGYETVDISSAITAGGSEIKFYAKVEGTGNTATEYWIMNDLGVVEAVFTANAKDGVKAEDFADIRLGGLNGPYTEIGNPDNGWRENKAYYVVHNGSPGTDNYVPWDQVSQLTFWYNGENGDPTYLTGITDVDIRVEAPVNGVSKVYLLYDVEYHNIYRNNGSAWDIDERNNWHSGSEYTIPANEEIHNSFNDEWYPQDYIDPDNGRTVRFVGWTTKDPGKIYEYNDPLPEYLVEGNQFTIDPQAENANNQKLYINLYGLWAYKDPFYVEKELTTVVRNGETLTENLDGMVLYPGDELTWTITAHNDSDGAITLHLWDVLTAMSDSASLPLTPVLTDTDGNPFTNGQTITVPANGTTTLYADYTVTDKDVGSTLQNTARVSDDPYLDPSNDPFDETKNEVANPKLTVIKTADKTTADVGDEITYTVNVTNNGETDLTNVKVSDDMWKNHDVANTVKVDETVATVTDNSITVDIASGASVTITYTYTVTEADVTAGSIVNSVTVDGGEEGGPGGDEETVWTGKVTITPADIVIYTGGDGYSNMLDADGNPIDSAKQGFPEPGYHLELPDVVETWLSNHSVDMTQAADLAGVLSFRYYDTDGTTMLRNWDLEDQGVYSRKDGTITAYVYSLSPNTVKGENEGIKVRLQIIDPDNSNKVILSDDITMGENLVSDQYDMKIYSGTLEQSEIQAVFTVGDESIACYVEIGTGKLTVKSTTNREYTNEIGTVDDNLISAVAGGNVTYFVNDSEVEVDNTGDRVKLLVDGVSNNDAFNNALGEAATDKVTGLDNVKFAAQYLDLVDTANGNAVVTLGDGQNLTLYWPVPSDAADDSAFRIVHYKDMDRTSTAAEENLGSANADVINGTPVEISGKSYITFKTSSFSPFVLVYEGEGSSSTSSGTTRYTLTYESNGGTEFDSERYTRNTTVQLDKTPTREGYTFTGWYADEDLEERITEIKMTSNKTVYAGWEPTDVPNWLNGDDHFSYIIGREDGLIHPDSNITRAEVATIFFRLLQEDVRDQYLTESNSFTDVSADAWYNTAISTMASMGIVEGDLSGTFRPDDNITRAEFAAIAARFSNGSYDGADIFNDIADHWAREEINLVASTGWLNGYTSGSFNPNREITRAESMTIVNRMLKRLPENTSDLLEGMIEWPDNQSESAWYYLAVQEATNSHDFERKDDGVHESWTELTENTDWEQYQ